MSNKLSLSKPNFKGSVNLSHQEIHNWQPSLCEHSLPLSVCNHWQVQVSDKTHYCRETMKPPKWHAHSCAETIDIFITPPYDFQMHLDL